VIVVIDAHTRKGLAVLGRVTIAEDARRGAAATSTSSAYMDKIRTMAAATVAAKMTAAGSEPLASPARM
jgi:hypothetical protein